MGFLYIFAEKERKNIKGKTKEMKKSVTIKGKKNTSITIGKYYENIIKNEISSGRYNSTSEVIRASLRLLEKEELKVTELKKNSKRNN